MSFFEVETWRPKTGEEAQHDLMIKRWFAFVQEHQDLFPEWCSARYYREVLRNEDQWTGRYVMVFEYDSYDGRNAYKERRTRQSDRYSAYMEVDPYVHFEPESVIITSWTPHAQNLQKRWRPTTPESFYDVVTWTPIDGTLEEHDAMMLQWYDYVEEHYDELFPEWCSVFYYQGVDLASGRLTDRYRMSFEYKNRAAFLAYKKRKIDEPDAYAAYNEIDPVVYFIEETKVIEHWQPLELDHWLDFSGSQ